MPNWCSNTLTVTGPVEEIARFRKESTGYEPTYNRSKQEQGVIGDVVKEEDRGEPELLNFHSLVPIPDEVLAFGFSHQYVRDKDGEPVKDDAGMLVHKEGLCGYDAQIEMWGTKWGSCEVMETLADKKGPWEPPMENETDTWVSYQFDTAWSPPEPWVLQVATLFPKCIFNLTYIEEGCDVQGQLMLKGSYELVNETTNVTYLSHVYREDEHYAWDIYGISDRLEEANDAND